MNFAQHDKNSTRRLAAIGSVAVLHLVIGYALVSGLARKVVEIYNKPVDVSIIEEVQSLPPPPKPSKQIPTPPAYAPKPETPSVAAPSPNAISATTSAAPPAEPSSAVGYAPAPVAVGAACPNHLAVRSRVPYPALAQRQGVGGEVLVEFTVATDGKLGNVAIVKSSNPIFNSTVIDAVSKFQCHGQGRPVRVRVPFAFKLES